MICMLRYLTDGRPRFDPSWSTVVPIPLRCLVIRVHSVSMLGVLVWVLISVPLVAMRMSSTYLCSNDIWMFDCVPSVIPLFSPSVVAISASTYDS